MILNYFLRRSRPIIPTLPLKQMNAGELGELFEVHIIILNVDIGVPSAKFFLYTVCLQLCYRVPLIVANIQSPALLLSSFPRSLAQLTLSTSLGSVPRSFGFPASFVSPFSPHLVHPTFRLARFFRFVSLSSSARFLVELASFVSL